MSLPTLAESVESPQQYRVKWLWVASDNFRSQVLCKPVLLVIAFLAGILTGLGFALLIQPAPAPRYEFRTPQPPSLALNLSRLKEGSFPKNPAKEAFHMRLRKVVHRKPVAFRPHSSSPDYLLCYCVETLECGHALTTYPQADPLIAVRRECRVCGSNLIEFPRSKKSSAPLRSKEAA